MEKNQTDTIIIKSKGNNNVFFERYSIPYRKTSKRDPEVCIIVNEEEESALLIKDGLALETMQGGKDFLFNRRELADAVEIDIIFMSKKAKIKLNWGTPEKFSLEDPLYGLALKAGMAGTIELQVANSRQFYSQIVGRKSSFDTEDMYQRISGSLIQNAKTAVVEYISKEKIPFYQYDLHLKSISESVKRILAKVFLDDYGIRVDSFIISRIVLDQQDQEALRNKKREQDEKLQLEQEEAKQASKQESTYSREDMLEDKRHQFEMERMRLDVEKEKALAEIAASKAKEEGVQCPFCSTKLNIGAKFCHNCGRSPKNICTKCNTENPQVARFCNSCGEKLAH